MTASSNPEWAGDGARSSITVRLTGDLDDAARTKALDRVRSALRSKPSVLVIDLTDLDFMDSSGLGVLVQSRREADAVGTTLQLLGVDSRNHRLIEMSGLTALFDL